jgi:hypothetical protein
VSIVIIPLCIYGLILVGHLTDLNDNDYTISENFYPLNFFMFLSRLILLLFFVGSAIFLLHSLKGYSLKIYRYSRYKILLTLVLGSVSLTLEFINFSFLLIENKFEENLAHRWKLESL